MPRLLFLVLFIALAVLTGLPGFAQQRPVDTRKTYERVYAVVPVIGSGTLADPKRPKYVPAPSEISPKVRTGILGYSFVLGEDGMALVEFVATDRKSFQSLIGDASATVFVRGRDSLAAVQAEFLKHKKDFDFTHFGVWMP